MNNKVSNITSTVVCADLVTDLLNSNCQNTGTLITTNENISKLVNDTGSKIRLSDQQMIENSNNCIPVINVPSAANNSNMIPTINITPHSPAGPIKYSSIFEDTLTHLQNIRESVVQMKNSSAHIHNEISNVGLMHASILSSSLPDLTALSGRNSIYKPSVLNIPLRMQQKYMLDTDRRLSWTAIDDTPTCGDGPNNSISLSSLDSEEQETIRVTEQRRRTARNSTGGISTHSLNEAELARDFERIGAKRNLATEIISRTPLQKSVSTSSIVAKEEIKSLSRHLTDSEDENHALLRSHAKIEIYDNVEKRRKRGSLFFRKKKDKIKSNTLNQYICCDICGANLVLANYKEHQIECKNKKAYMQKITLSGSRKGNEKTETIADTYDGSDHGNIYNVDPMLIRSEIVNIISIEEQDLGADPLLGITSEENDTWSPGVPKDILKQLDEKQIKRQEHIYEFIMTEKHHCQTLLVMQKIFVESLKRHFPALNVNNMFPRLYELSDLHTSFLRKLRQKQREYFVVDSIADILMDFFSLENSQNLRLAYGEFCANHRTALEQFKTCITNREQSFSAWYKHCLSNPLLKKKGIPECILFVTQRLTKYPLLIEPLLKNAREDLLEANKLRHALNLVKALLVDVDACVAEKELRDRQIDIYNRVDPKTFTIYKNKPFRKMDISVESRRRLKFEGLATLMQGRSKMQLVLVVVLTDCLCFLVENSAHNKYTFFTPEHKAGVVPLQKLLIREKAGTESRGIYIISSNPTFPEMYELKVQQPKDKNIWIQSIRQAVLASPLFDTIVSKNLTVEEKFRIGINKRDLIEKMRQKDIELALLLEEKIVLQMNLLKEVEPVGDDGSKTGNDYNLISAANFFTTFVSNKDIVSSDCDSMELWKRVLNIIQNIVNLASSVYTAATGLPVSRSVSSVGEKQSQSYSLPSLPKRAETFAGFDEKRVKVLSRETTGLVNVQGITPRLQELEENKMKTASPAYADSIIQTSSGENFQQDLSDQVCLKDHNYATLQISQHLHTLLCIILQQITALQGLQLEIDLYRENPKAVYTHNDQLEELRNLQDKLQEEKTVWYRQKEQQEQELEEMRLEQSKLREQIKHEQEDIKHQREQLYRKMELLSNQGLLLSPNTLLPPPISTMNAGITDDSIDLNDLYSSRAETPTISANTADRRKDKWRTASTTSKTPPVNLLSATNAPKINHSSVKQKLPMKLSSLSTSTSSPIFNNSKVDKSASFSNHLQSNSSTGMTQLFPLKLADKRSPANNAQHSRTGSSPAIIQHSIESTKADCSTSFNAGQRRSTVSNNVTNTLTSSKNLSSLTTVSKQCNETHKRNNMKPEEEEIYF